ncbi:MAG: MBL fold metallo-hydrolase [Sedimentisphaerales bacterium]
MNMLHITNHSKITPSSGKVIIFWLGGAGFLMKYADGFSICIDPYLSDSVERLCGFKRLHPSPINADDLRFDILFITHEHADHLDEDSIDMLINRNPNAVVYAPQSCDKLLNSHRIKYVSVSAGQKIIADNLKTTVIKADHGDLSLFAVGYIFEKSGRVIYHTGDTCYDDKIFKSAIKLKPDIILPCINGAYGNLNEQQAAGLVAACSPAHTIPMHFGLFKEHGGYPKKFMAILKELYVKTKVHTLALGEGIEI